MPLDSGATPLPPSTSTIDLHMHSTASDGALAPSALLERCAAAGLRVVSLTDHDSTEGLAEAQQVADQLGITLIPGIELGTDVTDGEIHILVYFPDITNREFQDVLLGLRDSRVGRARRMVEKLAALGKPIEFERVLEIAGDGAVGRPHVAQALVEAGHVESMREAFDSYIGHGGLAYAERMSFTPVEAVAFGRKYGGLPVFAHPYTTPDFPKWLPELSAAGLAGIECFYQGYDKVRIEEVRALALKHGLLLTGGTDFHGTGNWTEYGPGTTSVPELVLEPLFRAAGRPIPSRSN